MAVKEYFPREYAYREKGLGTVTLYSGATHSQYEYGLNKFLDEGKTLARFEEHPNIVAIRDFFKANDTAYLVMSYVEGVSFSEYLKKRGSMLTFDQTVKIMMPVLDALHTIHEVNLLHRDISPDNIYITKEGRVIILDFGAARQAFGEKGEKLSVILKPGYAPEEQYRSRGIQGPWTDIYAAAATLYHAITGQMPPDSLDRLDHDLLVPPSHLGATIDPADEAVLLKALSVKAEDRYQTVDAFQTALQHEAAFSTDTSYTAGHGTPALEQFTFEARTTGADDNRYQKSETQQAGIIHPKQQARYTRHDGNINIGRSPDNDLVLTDPTVSRYHARLFYEQGQWHLEDLNSTYGTFYNSERLTVPVSLTPSSTIRIADSDIYFDGLNLLDGDGTVILILDYVQNKHSQEKYGSTVPKKKTGLTVAAVSMAAILVVAAIIILPRLLGSLQAGSNVSGEQPVSLDQEELYFGTIVYMGGSYTGQLKNSLPHGQGTIVFRQESQSLDFSQLITPRGEQKYSGEWFEGKMHGEGTMTLSDGSVRKGIWNNDQYLGPKTE